MTVHWKNGWEDGQPRDHVLTMCTPEAWGLQRTAPCKAAVCIDCSQTRETGSCEAQAIFTPSPAAPGTQADTSRSPGPPRLPGHSRPRLGRREPDGSFSPSVQPWTKRHRWFPRSPSTGPWLLNALVFVL